MDPEQVQDHSIFFVNLVRNSHKTIILDFVWNASKRHVPLLGVVMALTSRVTTNQSVSRLGRKSESLV